MSDDAPKQVNLVAIPNLEGRVEFSGAIPPAAIRPLMTVGEQRGGVIPPAVAPPAIVVQTQTTQQAAQTQSNASDKA